MASPTQWTRAWVNSGSWWWRGRPGMLQSMGSQRVGHDWATEPNWTTVEVAFSCEKSLTIFSQLKGSFCVPLLQGGWVPSLMGEPRSWMPQVRLGRSKNKQKRSPELPCWKTPPGSKHWDWNGRCLGLRGPGDSFRSQGVPPGDIPSREPAPVGLLQVFPLLGRFLRGFFNQSTSQEARRGVLRNTHGQGRGGEQEVRVFFPKGGSP